MYLLRFKIRLFTFNRVYIYMWDTVAEQASRKSRPLTWKRFAIIDVCNQQILYSKLWCFQDVIAVFLVCKATVAQVLLLYSEQFHTSAHLPVLKSKNIRQCHKPMDCKFATAIETANQQWLLSLSITIRSLILSKPMLYVMSRIYFSFLV